MRTELRTLPEKSDHSRIRLPFHELQGNRLLFCLFSILPTSPPKIASYRRCNRLHQQTRCRLSRQFGFAVQPAHRNSQRLCDCESFIVHDIPPTCFAFGNSSLCDLNASCCEPTGQILLRHRRFHCESGEFYRDWVRSGHNMDGLRRGQSVDQSRLVARVRCVTEGRRSSRYLVYVRRA